jgi:hypothetical protein
MDEFSIYSFLIFFADSPFLSENVTLTTMKNKKKSYKDVVILQVE